MCWLRPLLEGGEQVAAASFMRTTLDLAGVRPAE